MTNYSRSVLKSNGPHHSKNLPVKFGFSSKSVPANIVQKLSAHSLLKSVFFRISTSLTNAPRSLSQAKVGTHLPLLKESHTRAHTAKHGAFSPLATVRLCAASEISFIPPRFYIHTFPGSLRTLTISNSSISDHLSSRFSTSRTNGLRLLSQVKAGTHSAFGEGSHTTAHTAKHGPSLPRPQCGFVPPAKYLIFRHAFIYIHFPVLCEPSTPAEEKNPAKLPP